jgi:hypothetical protein
MNNFTPLLPYSETYTIAVNQLELLTLRLVLEKFEFIQREFDVYKTLGQVRAEFDLQDAELKVLRSTIKKVAAVMEDS